MNNFSFTTIATTTEATITGPAYNGQIGSTAMLALFGDFIQEAAMDALCDLIKGLAGNGCVTLGKDTLVIRLAVKAYSREFINGGAQKFACKSKCALVDHVRSNFSDGQFKYLEDKCPEFKGYVDNYSTLLEGAQEAASQAKAQSNQPLSDDDAALWAS